MYLKVVTNLLGEEDEQATENADEVHKEVQGVGHKVLGAGAPFLDDQLCVVQHKATHHQQAQIKVGLVEQS